MAKAEIVWQGKLNDQDVRVVKTGEFTIAERLIGYDAMGDPRWELLRTRQALDELCDVLPEGLTVTGPASSRLPYGLVELPKGLRFKDLTRIADDGTHALMLAFPPEFEAESDSMWAVDQALDGKACKLVVEGQYARGAVQVRSATYYPKLEEPLLEEHHCAMVTEALRDHLRHGDPEERVALSSRQTVTARHMLLLLGSKDDRAIRFVQEVHNAALQAVRRRKRQPSRKPSW